MSYEFTVWLTGYHAPAVLPQLGLLQMVGARFGVNANWWQYAEFEVESLDEVTPGNWEYLLYWYSNTRGATITVRHKNGATMDIEPFGSLILEHLKSLGLR